VSIIDLALAVLAVGVVGRGLWRGGPRESLDLLALVLAVLFAFRLNRPVGAFIASWSGVASLPAQLMAGGIVFIIVVVVGTYLAGLVARRFDSPLTVTGRLVGGLLSLGWLTGLASVVLAVAVALPLDPGADGLLADSRVVRSLTASDSPAYRMVIVFDTERVLESMVNLDAIVGQGQVVIETDDRVTIPPSEDIEADRAAGIQIFDYLNLARVDGGLAPLAWSESLAAVGEDHAFEMYDEGFFAHTSEATGSVADRMEAAGIPYVLVGENLALAPTPENVHEGLMTSPGHRANIMETRFRRVGVGVYRGPLGLMVVQVFSG
jgi:hypothetical protein